MKSTTTRPTSKEQAAQFSGLCRRYGWTYNVRPNVIEIRKTFTAGSKREFTDADMEYGTILDAAPLRGGSVWGTDGGGIGGMVALQTGRFSMKKSGSGVAFTKALAALA